MSDLYKVLGVAKNASQKTIKKAYYSLSQVHHPDKPDGDAEKFKSIKNAYDILSNPESRKFYDETGMVVNVHDKSIAQEVMQFISALIDQWINAKIDATIKGQQTKSIGTCLLEMTYQAYSECERNIQAHTKAISTFEELLNDVQFKGEGVNLAEGLINQKLSNARVQLHVESHKLKALEECKKMANDYRSSEPVFVNPFMGTGTSGQTVFFRGM